MADAGIKKVTIKSAELPYIQFTTAVEENGLLTRDIIDQLYYDFRYRIVSEDKNRYSHWSPIEQILMPALSDVKKPDGLTPYFPYTTTDRIAVSITTNTGQKIAAVVWNNPLAVDNPTSFEKIFNKIGVFDVWLRWNTSNTDNPYDAGWTEWEYVSTVSSNSFATLVSNGYSGLDVAIQIPTAVKLRDYYDTKLTMFRKTSKV